MATPPLYVCPDCEPGPYHYAGPIIPKMCSKCAAAAVEARTGYDRARTGRDRTRVHPAIRRVMERQ